MQTAPSQHADGAGTFQESWGILVCSKQAKPDGRQSEKLLAAKFKPILDLHRLVPSLSGYRREGTTGLSVSLAGFFVASNTDTSTQTHGNWTRASEPSDGVSFLRAQILGARVERRSGQVRPGGPSCSRKIPAVPHSQIPVLAPGGVKFVNPPEASVCGSVPQRKDAGTRTESGKAGHSQDTTAQRKTSARESGAWRQGTRGDTKYVEIVT
jgi:hypothetical protein